MTTVCLSFPLTREDNGKLMPFGYHGCYLRIDVSKGTSEYVPLSDTVLRQYLGGSGLGVKLLLD